MLVGLWLCKNHDSWAWWHKAQIYPQPVFLLVAMGSLPYQDPSFSSIQWSAYIINAMKTMRWGKCTSSMLLSASESRGLPLVSFSVPIGNDGVSTPTCCSSNEVSVCILSSRSKEGSTVLYYYYYAELWWERREGREESMVWSCDCDTKILIPKFDADSW